MNCLLLAVTLMGQLAGLPNEYVGVWIVTHEQNPVTEKWERVNRTELRAEKTHFKLKDGSELAFDKVTPLSSGPTVSLRNGEVVIIMPSDNFIMVAWMRMQEGSLRTYRKWVVEVR